MKLAKNRYLDYNIKFQLSFAEKLNLAFWAFKSH